MTQPAPEKPFWNTAWGSLDLEWLGIWHVQDPGQGAGTVVRWRRSGVVGVRDLDWFGQSLLTAHPMHGASHS
jgi:hypothetical protein